MNDARPTPPAELPILTEVVPDRPSADEGEPPAGEAGRTSATVVPLHTAAARTAADLPAGNALDADEVFLDVLAELSVQIDRMVEYRLREALAPVVARAVDQLVNEARDELAHTLQDVLRRSLAQVIARNRPR